MEEFCPVVFFAPAFRAHNDDGDGDGDDDDDDDVSCMIRMDFY